MDFNKDDFWECMYCHFLTSLASEAFEHMKSNHPTYLTYKTIEKSCDDAWEKNGERK